VAQRRVREVVDGLKKAGFRWVHKKGDHDYYALHVNGQVTTIMTWVSRGSKGAEIGRKLLGLMAEETKLSPPEFLELIDGGMTHEQYVILLRERKFLQ
jgi:predicted RNA binding protein YcfA (HicA-like mRNA interferase family)